MAAHAKLHLPHSSGQQRLAFTQDQCHNRRYLTCALAASRACPTIPSRHNRRFQTRTAAALGRTENGVESVPVADNGDGGSRGSGNNNGGGGNGGGGSGGRGSGPGGASLWGLLAVAAASGAAFKLFKDRKNSSGSGEWWKPLRKTTPSAGQTSAAGGDSDVAILRRLVKEAFADLVKVRYRLDELEDAAGISEGSTATMDTSASRLGATVVPRGGHGGRRGRNGSGALSGSLEMGGGLLWSPDEGVMGEVLPSAGVKLGTDLALKMRGQPRGGRDLVLAECLVTPSTEQFSLKKVLYYLRLAPAFRLALAPLGATAQDAAYTLNPLAGQGLSGMVRHGSPMHQRPLGSLLGAALDSERAWGSAACAMQGAESGSMQTSLLAQGILALTPSLSLGLAALQQQATSDADVAPAAGHTPRLNLAAITPRGMGVSITPRGSVGGGGSGITPRSSGGGGAGSGLAPGGVVLPSPRIGTPRGGAAGSPAVSPWEGAAPVAGGAPLRQLSTMFAWRPDPDLVIHGWAAADGDAVVRSVQSRGIQGIQPEQWGISLGSYPDATGNGWALGLGRSAAVAAATAAAVPAAPAAANNGKDATAAPNLFELSLQFSLGDGLVVNPGLLCAVQDGRSTVFAGLKTAWEW